VLVVAVASVALLFDRPNEFRPIGCRAEPGVRR
jgi:hypothetical protein